MIDAFETAMVGAQVPLRRFAISMCGNADTADDLVQETFAKALANRGSFQAGTNLHAWLFTILRNHFRSAYRKRRREVEDPDDVYAKSVLSHPDQEFALQYAEAMAALDALPANQREAFTLIEVDGYTYEDAAEIAGTNIGTIKSRVHRAKAALEKSGAFMPTNTPKEQTESVRDLWTQGKGAVEIAAALGLKVPDVMRAIVAFGPRKRG